MKTLNVVAAVICEGDRILATQRGYGEHKDRWEFPGGKIEPGELITTVETDYPSFHLSMQCFLCTIKEGSPVLLEHEAAKWLSYNELDSVDWLPADRFVVEEIKRIAAEQSSSQ